MGQLIKSILENEALKAAIIGALGSIVGGIIGVAGSLIVLKIQNNKETSNDIFNTKKKHKSMIKLLIIEIEHNINTLKVIKDINKSEIEILTNHLKILDDRVWNEITYELLECLEEKKYIEISYIYRDLNLVKQQILDSYKHEKLDYEKRIRKLIRIKNELDTLINEENQEVVRVEPMLNAYKLV